MASSSELLPVQVAHAATPLPNPERGRKSPPRRLAHEEQGQQHERDGREVAVERAALFAARGVRNFLLRASRRAECRG